MWPFSKKAIDAALVPVPQRTRVNDNLVNFVMGMGTSHDRTQHTQYTPQKFIDRMTADAIFGTSWLGKRIITTIADDMCREWRTHLWDGSQDDTKGIFGLQKEEERLQVPKRVHSALKFSRQFGGSIMVMFTKDAKTRDALAEPLDVERVKKGDLLNLVVYDRWRVAAMPPNSHASVENLDLLVPYLNQTMDNPNFGLPEHYYLADTSVAIHHSRCIRFDGEELSWYEWARNGMWHDSVYRSIMRAVTNYDTLMAGAASMVTQANIDILMAQDFADMLSTDDGTARAQQRYQLMNMMKSLFGMIVLDKDKEDFKRQPIGALTGVRELCDKFALDVSGAADVPLTRLFGMPPSGLNTDGESNLINYENHIHSRQKSNLSPQMLQLDQVLVRSALGRMPDDYQSTWNPLRQMTDAQKATIEKTRADRDAIYIDRKVVTREACAREIRANRSMPNFTDKDVRSAAEADKKAAEQAAATPAGKPTNGQSGPVTFAGKQPEKLPA